MIRVRPPLFSPFFTFAYHACASLFDLDPLWILRIKMQIKAKLASAWALDFYLNVCIFDSLNSFAPPLDRHHSIVNSNCFFDGVCTHTLHNFPAANFRNESLHLSGIYVFYVLNHFSIEKTIEKVLRQNKILSKVQFIFPLSCCFSMACSTWGDTFLPAPSECKKTNTISQPFSCHLRCTEKNISKPYILSNNVCKTRKLR